MADCKHEFVGDSEGVKCSLCGLRLSHEEYGKYLHEGFTPIVLEKAEEKPKKSTKKSTKK